VTAYDAPYPIASIEEHYVPDARRIAAGVRKVLGA
jgi:hypothetical protein